MSFAWNNIKEGTRSDPAPINAMGNHLAEYHGLRLARQIIATEAVSSIQFDTDDAGQPLNSKFGGELRMYAPAGADTGADSRLIYIRLNNKTGNDYWHDQVHIHNAFKAGCMGAVRATICAAINPVAGYVQILTQYNCQWVDNTGVLSGSFGSHVGGLISANNTAVTALNIFGTFPAGTVVEWWERG